MIRRLQWFGALLIVVTVGLWVAETGGFIQGSTDDRWSGLTLKAALVALGGSLLLRVLAPIAGALRTGRCTVCGRSTKRGHTYCHDHLQATVNATRDETRNRPVPRPRPIRTSGR